MQHYQEAVALGSKTGLSLVISDAATTQIDKLYRRLWKAVFLFERRFSRFLPGSELSLFNRGAGSKQIISTEFRDLLLAADDMARQTKGLYNPFILPALQSSGYSHSRVPGREKDSVDDHSKKAVAAADRLEIGDNWARIPYGTAIDLGGCGKGYLADQLRGQIADSVDGYWFSFGGDIAVGGRDEKNQPWGVTIQSADDPTRDIGVISVAEPSGIATSGTTVHRGKDAGKDWHHLIDPRTLLPAKTDVLLATVTDESTLRADVLASCAVILGSQKGLQFLKQQGAKGALLQCRTKKGQSHNIHFGECIITGTAYA